MKRNLLRALAVGMVLFGQVWFALHSPAAHADQSSYLAAAHAEPALRGTNDLWLMAVGSQACAGRVMPYGAPGDAVMRLAHQELCP